MGQKVIDYLGGEAIVTHSLDTSMDYIKGDRWLRSINSLAIRVPSKVVPQDFNIVLNPLHPDYRKIRLLKVEDFDFDFRFSSIHS